MINDVIEWFQDPTHWQGDDGVLHRLVEHTLLTLVAMLFAMVVGLPLAVWLGHRRRYGTLAVNISNIGRAIPIVALLSLLALGFVGSADFGPFGRAGLATLITLALFALPPIITNAYVAVSDYRVGASYHGVPSAGVSGVADPWPTDPERYFSPAADATVSRHGLDFARLDRIRRDRLARGFARRLPA